MNNISEQSIVLNQEKKRFELEVEGKIAYIEFIKNNEDIMFLTHTEVPRGLEGKGVGSAIVSKTLDYIQENRYTLAPLCPFIAAYVKRHPERKEILAKGYNV